MERRKFLQNSGAAALALAALSVKGYTAPFGALLRRAEADSGVPLTSLKAALDPNECMLLVPADGAKFDKYDIAFNLRTKLKPQARVLVRSTKGVCQLVQWLKANKVPFAVRGGGHSFEGFSQSSSVVIDTRMMNSVVLDSTGQTVSVGGGAALGEVYAVTGKRNLAIPGGTCPPVGVSGHALGGGFGELGRQFGLACDSIVSIELVDATGTVLNCSDSENQDLFWALRGGGGGSFGVATKYVFRTHSVPQLSVFGYNWVLAPKPAAAIFKAWQQWIVQAPEQITANCRITTDANGTPTVHIAGVTVGAASALQAEIKKITGVAPQKQYITPKSFLDMVRFYSGGPKGDWPINEKGNNAYVYDQTWTKGKSDFVYDVMSDEGMLALFAAQQKHPGITALFDGYGASIAKVAPDATAFAHRKAIACVQHVSTFDSESLKTIKAPALDARLASVRAYYDSLRPYFSGKAYLNYPDRDLKDYATAYWGDNLERLKKIKAAVDPDNFYCHAQSVPV